MTKPTKFFRVAVEGATCDGREITRQDIVDMVATYAPATYGARVNMEHIRGLSADGPFKAYGDVLAVKSEPYSMELGGKTVTKLALLAQLDPTAELQAINSKSQKIYSSIEINPNFAGTGKAYLQGLAVTDSPASLGTEILKFAAGLGDANPFASRKAEKGNFFSAALETKIEFEEEAPPAETESSKLFAAATSFFQNFGKKADPVTPPVEQKPEPANDNALLAAMGEGFAKIAAAQTAFATETKAQIDKVAGDLATFKTEIEGTDADAGSRRKKASGAGKFTSQIDF